MASFQATGLFFLVLISVAVLYSQSESLEEKVRAVPPIEYPGTIHPFTEEQKNAMLNKHREERKSLGGANMEYMYWDDKLETLGEQWSSACLGDHSYGRLVDTAPYNEADIGQNIFYTTSTYPGIDHVRRAFAFLSDAEKQWYNYDENSCSAQVSCGHYTQIVWAATKKVGCGMAFCPNGAWQVTCHYSPPGNDGNRPYIKGTSCSQCASGSGWCFEETCRDCPADGLSNCSCDIACEHCGTLNQAECSCSCYQGWQGPSCSEECIAKIDDCDFFPTSYCSGIYATWTKRNCPGLCGVCEELTDADTPCAS